MNKVVRGPTHEELCDAHDLQDWDYLWRAAIPLVKFAIKQMMRKGEVDPHWAREDLLQEGLLAAGLAVRTWDTIEGKFSTWIVTKVRGHMLDYLGASNNGGIGGKKVSPTIVSIHENQWGGSEINQESGDEESLSQSRLESLEYPQGSGVVRPDDAALLAQVRQAVRDIEDPIEQDILMRSFGFDGDEESNREIAPSYGRGEKWVRQKRARALEKAANKLLGAIPMSRSTQ